MRRDDRDPSGQFAWLAHRLGSHPVFGVARDENGHRRHVVVDQGKLLTMASGDPFPPSRGQLSAAAVALRHGDPTPLLRLAAFHRQDFPGPMGNIHDYSAGANAATYCNDVDLPFSRTATVAVRKQQFADAVSMLSPGLFAPVSTATWLTWAVADYCIGWPSPGRFVPAVPKHAVFPHVPVLVLAGDIDTVVPISASKLLLDEYPDATYVQLSGAAHPSSAYSDCGHQIVDRFIRSGGDPGDTSCADSPAFEEWAQSAYPRRVAETVPATPILGTHDASTNRDRRATTAAVKAVEDAFVVSLYQTEIGSGPGLRGGVFDADRSGYPQWRYVLHDVRFVRDEAARGHVRFDLRSFRLVADVTVHGHRTSLGTLHIEGPFGDAGHSYRVHGAIGHRHVALRVPSD